MKTTHYGQDYCTVQIGSTEYELPIEVGKAVDRMNKKIKDLKK